MGGESFAQLLKRHRIATGLSQETLAERAGVSVDSISALERGARHAPYKATLDLLIDALTLDDDARREIEEAATLARARGLQVQRQALLGNLPPQLTSFVDREEVVAEIKEFLQSHRLVTLMGTGGAGKTRCAIKVAAETFDIYGDGVWLAELAPISDPSLVAGVIARTLRVQEAPNRPILDTLLAYLRRKRLLLLVDNCEHIIEEARHVVAAILQSCPDIRVLATSRESFSIAGEQVYRMPSLPVPSNLELSADVMSRYGAVQLFSDRAVSADNRFTLTVESAPHVADICRRLDGIPLAIELAAARVKTLSPKQLAEKLDERLRLLNVGDRSALPRHRTMRALIDWSYDLLSDDERRLFRKLSIFAGDFTLELAAAVCSNDDDEIVVLDLLSLLVDKSLLQTEPLPSARQYRLLDSIREYAREKLIEAGEYTVCAREHARAFLSLAEQLNDAWETTPDRVWYGKAEPELENFRAALGWALGARGDVLLGQRLAGALDVMWRYLPAEGRQWLRAAQQVDAGTPASVMPALDLSEAKLALRLGQYKASLHSAERALARCRELDDSRGIVVAELLIGRANVSLGKIAEGEAMLRGVLEPARSLVGLKSFSFALASLAAARVIAGDLPGTRERYSEALAAARVAGAERSAAAIVMNLADVEFRDGHADEALRLADEGVAVLRATSDIHNVTLARYNVAAYLVALRRYDEARATAREVLSAARDMQWSIGLAWTLQHVAAIPALRPRADVPVEDRRRAARILGYVDARIAALEALREYTEQQEFDAMTYALRDTLGTDELTKLMAEGSTWSEDRAVAEAMLI